MEVLEEGRHAGWIARLVAWTFTSRNRRSLCFLAGIDELCQSRYGSETWSLATAIENKFN